MHGRCVRWVSTALQKVSFILATLFAAPLWMESVLHAQDPKPPKSGTDASVANDPSSPLTQIQLQDWYHPTYDGVRGEGNEVLIRPIVPLPQKGHLPSSLIRTEIPVMSDPNGRTGLGDIQLIDWYFPGQGPKVKTKIGIGPVFVAPTATNIGAGQGQWQAGPSTILIYSGIKKLILGAITDNPISIGGERSRQGVNALTLEPLIIKPLPNRYFARFDPYWVFDWKEHGTATIPLNLALGRLVNIHGQLVNVYIEPEFLARRPPYPGYNPPRFTLRLAFHLLFPKEG